ALAAQTRQHRAVVPERMGPPRLAEPAQQSVLTGFDEYERRGVLSAQLPQDGGQLFKLAALARIHQQRRALNFSSGLHVQFTERGNERDGKIVNAVKAKILEGFENGALARTAEAGENHQLPGVARVAALHADRPTPCPGVGAYLECEGLPDISLRSAG